MLIDNNNVLDEYVEPTGSVDARNRIRYEKQYSEILEDKYAVHRAIVRSVEVEPYKTKNGRLICVGCGTFLEHDDNYCRACGQKILK